MRETESEGQKGMPKMRPKKLTSRRDRQTARYTRDFQWKFTEKVAEHDPLWFCVWNKKKLPEGPDEMRCCLLTGMDVLSWTDAHKDWFVFGEWSEERYALPVRLTDAGRLALAEREKYDMEPVNGGLVEPGFIVTPLPKRNQTNGKRAG